MSEQVVKVVYLAVYYDEYQPTDTSFECYASFESAYNAIKHNFLDDDEDGNYECGEDYIALDGTIRAEVVEKRIMP